MVSFSTKNQFFLILIIIFQSNSIEIQNCCPTNYSLTKIINGNLSFRPDKYICTNDTNLNINTKIYGIRIGQDNFVNIPNCELQNFIKLSEVIHLSSHSCLAKYDNSVYALTCPFIGQKDRLNPVNLIRKCCPFGKIYNKIKKQCINSNYDVNIFNRYFNQPIVFNDEQLKCPQSDDVIVEYFSKFHQFQFDGSSLIVPSVLNNGESSTYTFDVNTYCLDGSYNKNESDSNDLNDSSDSSDSSDLIYLDYSKIDFMVRTCNRPRICQKIPCVRRCCDKFDHKMIRLNGTVHCVPNVQNDLSIVFHGFETKDNKFVADVVEPRAYGVIYGQNCPKYKLDPNNNVLDEHYINHFDGSIHLPEMKSTYDHSKYCIEKYESPSGSSEMIVFVCFEDPDSDTIKFNLYAIGVLISCFFFILTLLVYLFIPKLRNLPGKILICLVLSLLIAYLSIAFGQLAPQQDKLCAPLAYFIYFSLIAAFAWMNVMCFDIWLTFGSTERTRNGPFGHNDLKRFLTYSLYALGLPALLTTLTICATNYNFISEDLQPKFGEGRCWFQSVHAASHLIFFLGPVGILFIINFILFVMTLKYCNHVKREIHRMQSTCDEKPIKKSRFIMDRARFMMNTKLFIVMGITWLLEILSTVFYNRSNMFLWIISDMFNVLQGVLVFFIFVFKWRVWNSILDRFGIKRYKHRLGITTTGGTTSTFAGSSGNLNNLIRMKSMESCSSLNVNSVNSTKRLSPNS